jgi:cytochrome c biogenesis protein CcmG/thiol:disulfide interchange protein DsbE
MKRLLLLSSLFLIVLIHSDPVSAKQRQAHGFALFNTKGKLVTLSSLSKQGNIILSFWASYCKPCIREMPLLVELEKKYKGKKNVRLILINIDKEGKEKALPILQQLNVKNECLLDIYQLTAKKYIPNLKVPALFLINTRNVIIFNAIGEREETIQELEKAIKKLR